MSARTFWATRFELAVLARDLPLLLLTLALPIATMVVGGAVFSQGLANIPLCITNEDTGDYGARLVKEFATTPRFRLVRATHQDVCRKMLRNGTVAATILVEGAHSHRLATEGRVNATVTVDNTNPFMGWLTMLECRKVIYAHLVDAFANDPPPALLNMRDNDPFLSWVYGEVQAFITPDMVYFIIGTLLGSRELLVHTDPVFLNYYLPGLLSMAVVFTATTLASLLIVRDREHGTLRRLLATPLSSGEYLAAKLAASLFISLVQAAAILLVLKWYLAVELNYVALMGVLAALALASCALGLLISSLARNPLHALEFALVIIVVQLLLSSLVFPNIIMPDAVRALEPIIPVTYGVAAVREIVLFEEPGAVSDPILSLVILSVLLCAAAWAVLSRE